MSTGTEVFPQRLRAARDLRKLSQGELALKAGLQSSAISHFETGTRKPSFENLRRLADALSVTTDYLLGRVNEVEALAGADQLQRHFSAMTAADRDTTELLMALLAKKSAPKKDGD